AQAKKTNVAKILLPIACSLIILVTLRFSGLFTVPNTTQAPQAPKINIMNDNTLRAEMAPDYTKAQEYYGKGFLIPEEIPEGMSLQTVSTALQDKSEPQYVKLIYQGTDKTMEVMEQKAEQPGAPKDYESVAINGNAGYLKSDPNQTECIWFVNGNQYSVKGNITREEALSTARSMK
ncbi:MAG: DUF4367 domain-containing protein, partial [Clostridia bacterium]|nr:DUF4367 domain-containing protein [Clostridia bacterium]